MQIEFIIPSYNDIRIVEAIKSIVNFDDSGICKISIYDGGSDDGIVTSIKRELREQDNIIVEHDKGVFDAINKGINNITLPYIGWLGSDDLISSNIKSSEVLADIKKNEYPDLISYITVMTNNKKATRFFIPFGVLLQKIGFHLPHYSTFVKSSFVGKIRFNIKFHPAADINFFLKLLEKSPHFIGINRVFLLMEEGGVSNSSFKDILKTNIQIGKNLQNQLNPFHIVVFLINKVTYKVFSKILMIVYNKIKTNFLSGHTK